MKFIKYEALGNDYIVMPQECADKLTAKLIGAVCNRHYGIGSDGILLHNGNDGDKAIIRIFNPDGSEAEKSGNGLRIFSRYLWDEQLVNHRHFCIQTMTNDVYSTINKDGTVSVEMGKVSFKSKDIPVDSKQDEVLRDHITINGEDLCFSAATIGNPHCVLVLDEISAALAKRLGPSLETHPIFPNRTNVQFMKVLDRNNIQIEIWERGAGYTLSSGSSSSAAAAVSNKLGLTDNRIDVHTPGGIIHIEISEGFAINMSGPVRKIGEGKLAEEFVRYYSD